MRDLVCWFKNSDMKLSASTALLQYCTQPQGGTNSRQITGKPVVLLFKGITTAHLARRHFPATCFVIISWTVILITIFFYVVIIQWKQDKQIQKKNLRSANPKIQILSLLIPY